ncbi:Putative transcriptional regulator%2C TetR family [Mycobacteroides abscessus]|nr:Putative transcriptional regulator%2C TetR family [Mycobacteroides abscessus]
MTEKVSRDDYFTAAFELLAIGGKSALTTPPSAAGLV